MVLHLPFQNLKMLVFEERGELENLEKNVLEQGENQQQTQTTYGIAPGNQTQATLVGGECSHHHAILVPRSLALPHNGRVQDLNYRHSCQKSWHFNRYNLQSGSIFIALGKPIPAEMRNEMSDPLWVNKSDGKIRAYHRFSKPVCLPSYL